MPSGYKPNFAVFSLTASTTLTDFYAGTSLALNAAAGLTVTLPAATGTGATYEFWVGTTVTSNSYIIQVASASDVMTGTATLLADGGDTVVAFATAGTSDTITMNGTTTGGITGAHVKLVDIGTGKWGVYMISDASGTEATPFSAAV